MRMFLSEGMSLDACKRNWNPMTLAAAYDREDIVKCFLEKGVDPNPKEGFMVPLLFLPYASPIPGMRSGPFDCVITHGHECTVRLLVRFRTSMI